MIQRTACLLLLIVLLTGCGGDEPPTAIPPTATAAALPPTATALPPTATALPPTTQPTAIPPTATAPLLDSFTFQTTDNIIYTPPNSPDPQAGILWLPKGRHYDAAVLLVHGGGLTSGNRHQMSFWATRLAAQGFVVFSIDYPLQPQVRLNVQIQAVREAVAFLRAKASIWSFDPGKIAIHGLSAGALLGGAAFVNPTQVDEQAAAFFGFYGIYSSDPDLLKPGQAELAAGMTDTVLLAANAPGPVILWHGTNDRAADWRQSERFAQALQAAEKDVTFNKLAGLDHVFDYADGGLSNEGEAALKQIVATLKGKLGAQ